MGKLLRFVPLACALALAACSAEASKPTPPPAAPAAAPEAKPAPMAARAVTATAKVAKVDQKKRMVTLKGADGKTKTIHVGPEVKNLPQVKAGDTVVVTYYESIALAVKKKGEAEVGVTSASDTTTAEEGKMPAAVTATTTTITAKITAIDTENQTVTVKGPRGNSVTVKAQDPANLAKLKKGDLVQLTYTEAVAVSVERQAKAGSK
jgi:hypothetical protein